MEKFGSSNEIRNLENIGSKAEDFRQIKPLEGTTFQESKQYWSDFFKGQFEIASVVEYYSEYKERIARVPVKDSDRGNWDGERGESKFIPNESNSEIIEILKKYRLDGIIYKDAIPNFSKTSESTVEIKNMTDNRAKNFTQCDEACAKQWNKEGCDGRTDWTPRDVANWRKENGYSWHERNDMKTCDLVPTKINDFFGHLGGVSECKKRDSGDFGGDFDE